MMTPAYDPIYLSRAARIVGNMLHDAVLEFGYGGADFLQRFIQSGIAEQIETGNPKYVAGKSGLELFLDVIERTSGERINCGAIVTYERSDVYWVGWMLTHYQWYSGRSFQSILAVVPYHELLGLYDTLHEADIRKSYEVLDAHMATAESKLKSIRRRRGITQEELAKQSGVSLNTIRAYERKAKSISKAQVDIVMRLTRVLQCDIKDILE